MSPVTVIIPTYNRPEYLKRILDYYKISGADLEYIVADSSSAANQLLNQKIIDFYNSQGDSRCIRYSYAGSTHLWEKLADAASKVKTEYCVICADDDFVISEGIRESVRFLENNPDFSLTHGRYLGFYVQNKGLPSQKFCWKNMYPHKSIVSDSAKDRFAEHFMNYHPTMYAVHRTPILQTIWSETIKSGVDPFLFGELMASLLSLVYGKMKVLDILYAARQEDMSGASTWPSLARAEKEGRLKEEYEKFKACLTYHLVKASVERSDAARTIDDLMEKYRKSKSPLHDYRINIAQWMVKFSVRINLSPRFYNFGKTVYRFFFPSLSGGKCGDLEGTSLGAYNDDFKILRKVVLACESK